MNFPFLLFCSVLLNSDSDIPFYIFSCCFFCIAFLIIALVISSCMEIQMQIEIANEQAKRSPWKGNPPETTWRRILVRNQTQKELVLPWVTLDGAIIKHYSSTNKVILQLMRWKNVQYECAMKMRSGISTGQSLLIPNSLKQKMSRSRSSQDEALKGTRFKTVPTVILCILAGLYINPLQLYTIKSNSTQCVERMFSVSVL